MIKQDRRGFIRTCLSLAAGGVTAGRALAGTDPMRRYQRVALVDKEGRKVRASELETGVGYLFHYPYLVTPCFLIDLGEPANGPIELETEDGDTYQWAGGVGERSSVVAFSAICAHKMTHPARSVSFINYRHQPVTFRGNDKEPHEQAGVIYCCSEKSVYDARDGGRVLGGPARQPLAAVILEYDPDTDTMEAVGTRGGEMFERFLTEFRFRLQLEHGITDIRREVADASTVVPVAEYCRNQVLC